MDIEIKVIYKGGFQVYTLYEITIGPPGFKFYPDSIAMALGRAALKDFANYNTIRDALIAASGYTRNMEWDTTTYSVTLRGHHPDFKHFIIDGHQISDLTFLDFK